MIWSKISYPRTVFFHVYETLKLTWDSNSSESSEFDEGNYGLKRKQGFNTQALPVTNIRKYSVLEFEKKKTTCNFFDAHNKWKTFVSPTY